MVTIPHELEVCPNCNASKMSRVDVALEGWLPMSRRERRRARKASKNLVMYRTEGRRPWNVYSTTSDCWGEPVPHDPLVHPEREYIRCNQIVGTGYTVLDELREPSGFMRMSQIANVYSIMRRTFDEYGEALKRLGDD